jgi:diguanylate cyclase (GGDEF)-like protein
VCAIPPFPRTQAGLRRWVRQELRLLPEQQQALLEGIDAMVTRQELLWERSKADAITALTTAFRSRIDRLQQELAARDATVSNITEYFEQLISELAVRATHDAKTQLMNFARFQEHLEACLTREQRGRWCAVGLVDVTSFKWYNDTLGHAVGDRILEVVARILRDQVRTHDLLAHDAQSGLELHARFGGDEFCFLVQELDGYEIAGTIADRFANAVRQYDWGSIDEKLQTRPVRVDVGVACLLLGPVAVRRNLGSQLARDLLLHADKLMYRAKHDGSPTAYLAAFEADSSTGLTRVAERTAPADNQLHDSSPPNAERLTS